MENTRKCETTPVIKPCKINEKETKTRIVKSKCMADMLVWLGFEYEKGEEGYIFERTYTFDNAWKDIHYLRQCYRK